MGGDRQRWITGKRGVKIWVTGKSVVWTGSIDMGLRGKRRVLVKRKEQMLYTLTFLSRLYLMSPFLLSLQTHLSLTFLFFLLSHSLLLSVSLLTSLLFPILSLLSL